MPKISLEESKSTLDGLCAELNELLSKLDSVDPQAKSQLDFFRGISDEIYREAIYLGNQEVNSHNLARFAIAGQYLKNSHLPDMNALLDTITNGLQGEAIQQALVICNQIKGQLPQLVDGYFAQVNPKIGEYHYDLGVAQEKRGQFQLAEHHYKEAAEVGHDGASKKLKVVGHGPLNDLQKAALNAALQAILPKGSVEVYHHTSQDKDYIVLRNSALFNAANAVFGPYLANTGVNYHGNVGRGYHIPIEFNQDLINKLQNPTELMAMREAFAKEYIKLEQERILKIKDDMQKQYKGELTPSIITAMNEALKIAQEEKDVNKLYAASAKLKSEIREFEEGLQAVAKKTPEPAVVSIEPGMKLDKSPPPFKVIMKKTEEILKNEKDLHIQPTRNPNVRDVSFKDKNDEKIVHRFSIQNDRLTSSDKNIDTYVAMLKVFQASYPDKEPRIAVSTPEIRDAMIAACKQVKGLENIDFASAITVRPAASPATPARAMTADPPRAPEPPTTSRRI